MFLSASATAGSLLWQTTSAELKNIVAAATKSTLDMVDKVRSEARQNDAKTLEDLVELATSSLDATLEAHQGKMSGRLAEIKAVLTAKVRNIRRAKDMEVKDMHLLDRTLMHDSLRVSQEEWKAALETERTKKEKELKETGQHMKELQRRLELRDYQLAKAKVDVFATQHARLCLDSSVFSSFVLSMSMEFVHAMCGCHVSFAAVHSPFYSGTCRFFTFS